MLLLGPFLACTLKLISDLYASLIRGHSSLYDKMVTSPIAQGLDPRLVPYLRLAHATTREEVTAAEDGIAEPSSAAAPLSNANETEALHHLAHYLFLQLARCVMRAPACEAMFSSCLDSSVVLDISGLC